MFSIGLENGTEGRSQAWVLGHPGCFPYGTDGEAALEAVPGAIQDYRKWIEAHTSKSWLEETDLENLEYRLDETWECYSIDPDYELTQEGYEVNAWFATIGNLWACKIFNGVKTCLIGVGKNY